MLVKIISPEKTVLQSEANEVMVSTEEGDLGILNHHMPLIGTLKPGKIRVRVSDAWSEYQSGKGLLEVQGNQVLILLDD